MFGANNRGFGLLDVLVALTVVGLVAVAALAVVASELRAAERAQRSLEGIALAEFRLAELRLLHPPDIDRLLAQPASGRFGTPFDAYGWRVLLRPYQEDAELLEAQVTVDWQGGSLALASRFHRAHEWSQ